MAEAVITKDQCSYTMRILRQERILRDMAVRWAADVI
jgi:hypothetical protein